MIPRRIPSHRSPWTIANSSELQTRSRARASRARTPASSIFTARLSICSRQAMMSRRRSGTPRRPSMAPASWPATARPAPASSVRNAAGTSELARLSVLATHHSAASSVRATRPKDEISPRPIPSIPDVRRHGDKLLPPCRLRRAPQPAFARTDRRPRPPAGWRGSSDAGA